MKNAIVLFLMIFTVESLYAQSYEIGFTGTGASTVVDSVRIENLNLGTSLTIEGNDILQLSIATGTDDNATGINSLQVYPNPMTDQAEVQFFVNEGTNVLLALSDISGRTVLQLNKFLYPGMHKFRVSGLHQGIYIIRIKGESSCCTAKLVSQNRSNGEAVIEYVSSENIQSNQIRPKQLKSAASQIYMIYNNGDRLKFTGMSGHYSTVITDVPSGNGTVTFDFMDCTDADGNHYPVVKIGTQIWMAKNLGYLPVVSPPSEGSYTEPLYYVWGYEGDSVNEAKTSADYGTYGVLYNWPAAMAGATGSNANPSGVQGVCPSSWHLPSQAEWMELYNFLGGEAVAGGKLKETGVAHWFYPNEGATDSCGFSALPGGVRNVEQFFWGQGSYGWCWSAADYDAWGLASSFYLCNLYKDLYPFFCQKELGFSVRCVRD
jgi:uncharacterized protein (TIGR02145 family)